MTKKRCSLLLLIVCFVLVLALPSQAAPRLSQKSANLLVGESVQLNVSGAKKPVVWSSSDKSVARVRSGLVKARKAGRAVIVAKVGKRRLTCSVTVKASALKVPVSTVTIKAGKKRTIKVSLGGYGRINVANDNSEAAHIELGKPKDTVFPVTIYGRSKGISVIEITSSLNKKKSVIRVTVTD